MLCVVVLHRLKKLHSLMSTFQTKVSDMEQRQGQQRGVAQHSLRNEMASLQKRIMQQAVGCYIRAAGYG